MPPFRFSRPPQRKKPDRIATQEEKASSVVKADSVPPCIGMHGERIVWVGPHCQLYLLGHGVRCYDPAYGRFLSQDIFSPFSIGGVNPYGFCSGDPVNRSDPSGYADISNIDVRQNLILGLGNLLMVFLGFTILLFAGGAGIALWSAILSGALMLSGGVLQILGALVLDDHPALSTTLIRVANGFYIVSVVFLVLGQLAALRGAITARTVAKALAAQSGRSTLTSSRRSVSSGMSGFSGMTRTASNPESLVGLAGSKSASNWFLMEARNHSGMSSLQQLREGGSLGSSLRSSSTLEHVFFTAPSSFQNSSHANSVISMQNFNIII